LRANGRVDMGMTMAVDVAPQATDAIEVLPPLGIDERATVCVLDEPRLVLGHLGERVPNAALVEFFETHALRSRKFEAREFVVGHGGNYHSTEIGVPKPMPSMILALSPTMVSSNVL
jgi:hypothetical protein